MSLSMAIMCPSTGGHEEAVKSWEDTMSKPWIITVDDRTTGDDAGFLTKCEKMWRDNSGENLCNDVIAYFHNDLFIMEHGWDTRVLKEFDDPQVAIVGFVGGRELGRPDIYRVPYHFTQLARNDVWSGMVDAESHGGRTDEAMDLAVVDSCAVIVRRSLLVRTNGWPIASYPNSSHCSDLWICSIARRLGFRTRLVPVKCQHRGGGKGEAGAKWLGGRDGEMHQDAHRRIYQDFKDVLPFRVK